MDLGLKGRKAIVCAASKGLGKGCAMSLAREGAHLLILARGRDALEATAAEIRAATGATVRLEAFATVGDKVLIEGTGAYTTTYAAVAFNGFPPLKQYVI